MRTYLIIVVFTCISICSFGQNENRKFSYVATIGTGIPMSKPSPMPFTAQIKGYYNIGQRFSAGIGTGISFYEKALIPIFADAKFLIIRPHRFTPYIECGIGYSFAPDKKANGGFYINPNAGIQYSIGGHKKLLLSIGYEHQKLERLKGYENDYFEAQFKEVLSHHHLVIKAGVQF